MTITPDYGTQRGGFFKTLRADINKAIGPDDNKSFETGDTGKAHKDSKDALGTKDYAESVKNLNLALMTMKPPEAKRIDAPIELKSNKTPAHKENVLEFDPDEDDDLTYFFIGDNSEDFETSADDYDEFLEMSLEKFLKETEGGDFDILPVLYNLNYSSNGDFMPESIDKVVLPHPESGDQIVLYTKDGKRAFIDFVTGRRIVQVPGEDGNFETKLIDDDGYKFGEDTYFLYSPKKKFRE